MYCKNCGKEINDNAIVCIHCGVGTGVPVNTTTTVIRAPIDDTMTGGLTALCILLPYIGVIVGIIKLCMGAKDSGGKCIKYSLLTLLFCGLFTFLIYMAVIFNR